MNQPNAHVDPLLTPPKQSNPHSWGEPLAGQGSANICTQCGARKNANTEGKECNGPRIALTGGVQSDYDPLKG